MVPSIVNSHQLFLLNEHPFLLSALNEHRILLQTPLQFAEQNANELEDFFEVYFSSCIQQTNPTANLPFFQVRQDAHVVQQFIEFYSKILDESKRKTVPENISEF